MALLPHPSSPCGGILGLSYWFPHYAEARLPLAPKAAHTDHFQASMGLGDSGYGYQAVGHVGAHPFSLLLHSLGNPRAAPRVSQAPG